MVKYIITKDVNGLKYYARWEKASVKWHGLKDNAEVFASLPVATRMKIFYTKALKDDSIKIEELQPTKP